MAFSDFSAFLTMLSSVRALLSEHAASLAEQAAFVGGKSMSENDAQRLDELLSEGTAATAWGDSPIQQDNPFAVDDDGQATLQDIDSKLIALQR